MQQKSQFIVTILHEPQLLIFDEPFSGFDPINANLLKNEILSLKEKGATIIFSTHNMGSVEELCDNIALIHKSKKVLEGSTKQIREQYKSNEYRVEYSGSPDELKNVLNGRFHIIDDQTIENHHSAKIRINKEFSSNDLLEALISTVTVKSFNEIIPSMNDVFIKVVEETDMADKKELENLILQ